MKTEIEYLDQLEDDLLIAAEIEREEAVPRRPRARISRRVVVALAAVFIAVAGFVGYTVRAPQALRGGAGAISAPGPAQRAPSMHGGPQTPGDQGSGLRSLGRATDAGADTGFIFGPDGGTLHAAGTPVAQPSPAPNSPSSPTIGPKIVKTADLDIRVKKGEFTQAFREASLIGDRYGGYIASSSMGGSTAKEGSLTMRVPARNFAQAVVELSALGQTIQERIDGEDVTADYVDLQGRIRTWTAQEAVLLRLMARAETIDQTLTVQRQLQNVQLQIEHLRGQLRVLRDQVADGTISVSLREPSPPRQQAKAAPIAPGFGDTWRKAAGGFLDVVASVAIGLAYLIPIALIALGILLLVRRARGRVRA